ncbi:MAG TPA: hypothetical protein GXX17_07250 [Clostridiales bacterium]|nr:hypothetical protein [Clostridiales bacterium]
MEDLASKLSKILESPEGLERVRSLAGALLGGTEDDNKKVSGNPLEGLLDSVSPKELTALVQVSRALKSSQHDDRSRLLLAIRPHLHSEERKARIDQAVTILRLISILPIIKEQGLI